jgi:hypothetical protein
MSLPINHGTNCTSIGLVRDMRATPFIAFYFRFTEYPGGFFAAMIVAAPTRSASAATVRSGLLASSCGLEANKGWQALVIQC